MKESLPCAVYARKFSGDGLEVQLAGRAARGLRSLCPQPEGAGLEGGGVELLRWRVLGRECKSACTAKAAGRYRVKACA
jgi:hypothetical protein